MCLNRKVLIGLSAVALGVLVFDRTLLGHVLPLLLFALCPLSMVFMMRGMSNRGQGQGMSGMQSCGMKPNSMSTGLSNLDGSTVASEGNSTVPFGRSAEDEVARLRAEIDQLRAERTATTGQD